MNIKGKMMLVIGANGGIGGALVKELLDNGALKVYAAARSTAAVKGPTGIENAREEMKVNFFGTQSMCRAFAAMIPA